MAKKRKRKPTATKPSSVTRPKAKRTRKASPSSSRKPQKKPPTLTVKQGGRKPATVRSKRRAAASAKVKPFAAAVKVRTGGIHAKPPPARPRKLSKHPDAVRARKYRREKKALAEALEVARLERLEKRRERDRQRREKRRGGGGIIQRDERELAVEWLEAIRDHFASFAATSLEIVPAETNVSGAWMIVGRFDFLEDVDYEIIGAMLEQVADDIVLEARIHPQRLSQIRILFSDPNAKRGEGDSFVSRIAGWQFVLGDMVGEILGGSAGDESALATRYKESTIPTIYIYFSPTITAYETVWGGSKTKVGGAGSAQKRTQLIRLR